MRRRTRSVDRGTGEQKPRTGLFKGGGGNRRAQSVERPARTTAPKRHNALMQDDEDSYYPSSKRNLAAGDYVSGDDESAYSKKSSNWFGGSSSNSGPKHTAKSRADYEREQEDLERANERAYNRPLPSVNNLDRTAHPRRGGNASDERIKVMPDAAYPNTFLNREELQHETNLKSVYFHDVRTRSEKAREVGQLRLEILQCFGIPATTSIREEVSAYCIAVCGSHAFKTDVMPPLANPMWLSKMRRACLFPVLHAYARVFIGVFDNATSDETGANDFIGRVVIDIARLRPGCSYDFTLPLRLSSNVFTRQQQGAIRVRLHLLWHSERAAILSYIPKQAPSFRPQEDIHVSCLDEVSFKNVAHTVHGLHMPGKFTMTLLKSTAREVNFTRIHILRYLRRREIWNLVFWKYPVISGFVFCAWMHSVWNNTTRYIPGHLLTFLLLHLYKNYAYYGMDSPLQNGFLQPSIEELFRGLAFGTRKSKKKYLEPLNMEMEQRHAVNPEDHMDLDAVFDEPNYNGIPLKEVSDALRKGIRLYDHKYRLKTYKNCFAGNEAVDFLMQSGYAFSRHEAVALGRKVARELRPFEHITKRHDFEDKPHHYHFVGSDTTKYMIKGHKPRFKRLAKLLGFAPEEDGLLTARGHVEFPFATGADHPRFTVKEALMVRSTEVKKRIKDEQDQQEIVDCAEFGVVPAPPLEQNPVAATRFITNAAGGVVNVAADVAGDVMKAGIGAMRAGVRRASLLGNVNQQQAAAPPTPKEGEDAEGGVEEGEKPMDRHKRISLLGGMTAVEQQKMMVSADTDDVYTKLKSRNNPTLDELLERQWNADAYDEFAYDSDDDVEDVFKKKSKGYIIEEKLLKPPPNQDMGIKIQSGDKSFAKTVAEARHKAHGMLLHLFNDRTYLVNRDVFPTTLQDDSAEKEASEKEKEKKKKRKNKLLGAFGVGGDRHERGRELEEEEEKKKKRPITPFDARVDECDKILGINKYSHPNPWINRVGVIVQPIIEIVQGWLYLARAIFNIFTWQDPVLSFLVAVAGPVAVLVLHFFPYRVALFFVGIAVVGPQNYVLRLFRESKGDPPPDFDKLFRRKKTVKKHDHDDPQYFSSAAPGNQNVKYVNVDPQQVRNVLVPYGPLKYNRFYDWPPEPQYARVYASPPPRNTLEGLDYDSDDSDEEGFQIDARTVKSKKKKKKKGMKKLASQVKKGTGTVVFGGAELAKRTTTVTQGAVTGVVGLAGGAVMGTAHLTTNVAKGTVGVARGAVKGTVKGAGKGLKRGAKGVMSIGKRGNRLDDYDDDDSY